MGRTYSPALGIFRALMPVLFCGGFLVYFAGVERWTGVPVGDALTPTVFGLGILALLFAIPLVLRIARLLGPPPPRKPGSPPRQEPLAPGPGDFDADAAIARYLARREPASPPSPPAPAAAAQAPPSFGRKTR
ncbi:MAG TPA: hypothetical protein VD887_13610 [Allosphingosinicella sp.]|nr:hypothetical protein [Allosphingosinicella sp.]HYG31237.1 hypothetical protein [Allosphingosinicella sp.]